MSDRLGFEQIAKSFVDLVFGERSLRFRQVFGVKSFTKVVGGRNRVDEGRQRGKCKSSDQEQESCSATLHIAGAKAIAVLDPNVAEY